MTLSFITVIKLKFQDVNTKVQESFFLKLKNQYRYQKLNYLNTLVVIPNQYLINRKGGSRRNVKPRIPPHPAAKQGILFLRRMRYPAREKMDRQIFHLIRTQHVSDEDIKNICCRLNEQQVNCKYDDTASCARVYQHDVRAKQTKVCDAERAWFQASTHASNYLETDEQLKLAAVSPPVDERFKTFDIAKLLIRFYYDAIQSHCPDIFEEAYCECNRITVDLTNMDK